MFTNTALSGIYYDPADSPSPPQVRLTHQFEEGVAANVHLVSAPKKAKMTPGPCRYPGVLGLEGNLVARIHLQNARFSLTTGVPPTLVHSWEMVDLR